MNSLEWSIISIAALLMAASVRADSGREPATAVLVIHGGAGVMPREKLTDERQKHYRADLEKALRQGHQALERDGGTSLDAVEAAIRVLEDSPIFNAGKGAVFTHDGRNELDASIMDGKEMRAGAVAAVTCIKNPISAARAVMEKSPHVMLVGRGAELFATEQGLEIVDPGYFWTLERWQELRASAPERKSETRSPRRIPRCHRRQISLGNRRRRGAGSARQSRRRDVDRRHDEQGLRPCGRLAHYWCRDLCRKWRLRRVRDRAWRAFHPPCGGPRYRRPYEIQEIIRLGRRPGSNGNASERGGGRGRRYRA